MQLLAIGLKPVGTPRNQAERASGGCYWRMERLGHWCGHSHRLWVQVAPGDIKFFVLYLNKKIEWWQRKSLRTTWMLSDMGAEVKSCPCAGNCQLQLPVGQRGLRRVTHSSTTHAWPLTIYFYRKSGSPLWPEMIISLLPVTFFMNKKQFLSFTSPSMLREK